MQISSISTRFLLTVAAGATLLASPGVAEAQAPKGTPERLQYHPIRTDKNGKIVPWFADDLGASYDHVIRLTWKFWDNMAADRNGLPYHMNHQVWDASLDDHRGIGGDQIQMALSSWQLLYQYMGTVTGSFGSGWDRIVENMRFMADWYLTHGLSSPKAKWPNIPYPYNTLVYSGVYDGDMILGKGYTQPDKAGSLGIELVKLWKITGNERYLDAAIDIADTLAAKTKPGDGDNSPLPFKVHAETGEIGLIKDKSGDKRSSYTTNWGGTLELWAALGKLDEKRVPKAKAAAYKKAFDVIIAWMKKYPLATNKWGPFFEDIEGWSDTQINAVTFASFMMENPALFPEWKTQVRGILDWAMRELGNKEWEKYGVVVMNEQTAYRVPGNSHSSRQAAAELRYAELTGDTRGKENAIRQLSWATYMVDTDGKNRYMRDDVWMTDGYGDYVRHYLRAMAAAPELAPVDQDHILRSSTVVSRMRYGADKIRYTTFDTDATELLRLTTKPKKVLLGNDADLELAEVNDVSAQPGWTWQPLAKGGLLTIRRQGTAKTNVTVLLK